MGNGGEVGREFKQVTNTSLSSSADRCTPLIEVWGMQAEGEAAAAGAAEEHQGAGGGG